jgi:hypothetical protein
MPSDMTHPPLDLRGTIDARRERRSRQRAAGAGLVALCGFALFGVAAARHFVRS